nr:hypothetical protein [Tanacetum cinerariifolium]
MEHEGETKTRPRRMKEERGIDPSRGREVTLTIVEYGHDAAALSPELEEGGISQAIYYVYEYDISTGMGVESKIGAAGQSRDHKQPLVAWIYGTTGGDDALSLDTNASKHLKSNMLKKPVAGMVEKATVVLNSVAYVEEGKNDVVYEGGISALAEVIEDGVSVKWNEFVVVTFYSYATLTVKDVVVTTMMRKQKKSYEEAFSKHKVSNRAKVGEWKGGN